MGGRVTTRPLDLPDYSLQIHWGNALLDNLWGRSCHSSKDWIPHAENEFFHSKQRRWAIGEEFRLDRRMKRKCHGPIGLLSTQAQARVWCQRKAKATNSWRFGLKKVFGNYEEPSMGKIGTQMGRAYCITSVAGIGAYYLEDLEEKVVPRPWNVHNLKRYYY